MYEEHPTATVLNMKLKYSHRFTKRRRNSNVRFVEDPSAVKIHKNGELTAKIYWKYAYIDFDRHTQDGCPSRNKVENRAGSAAGRKMRASKR